MLAGCAVSTNGGQHTSQEVKLIRYKGIYGGEVFSIGIELLFHAVVEDDFVLDVSFLLVIEESQSVMASIVLLQNSLADDLVHIGRGQGQTGIETTLDFRKVILVVADLLGYRVNILLAGDDNPRLALAGSTQILCHSLEIQHQVAAITNVLTNLVDQKDNMMVLTLLVDIPLDELGKILNTLAVDTVHSLLAPVAGSFFAHKVDCDKSINHIVLNEVKLIARFQPGRTIDTLKFRFEVVVLALFGQGPLQICNDRIGLAETLSAVKYAQKDRHNGILALFALYLTLGINIEKYHIGELHPIC